MTLFKILFILSLGFGAGWLSAEETDSAPPTFNDVPAPATEAIIVQPSADTACTNNCSVDSDNINSGHDIRQDDISKANGTMGPATNGNAADGTPATEK